MNHSLSCWWLARVLVLFGSAWCLLPSAARAFRVTDSYAAVWPRGQPWLHSSSQQGGSQSSPGTCQSHSSLLMLSASSSSSPSPLSSSSRWKPSPCLLFLHGSNYLESLGSSSMMNPLTTTPPPSSTTTSSNAITTRSTSATTTFHYVPVLGLAHADAIANAVIACCRRNQFKPISVYVLDAAGHTLVSKRMDGCAAVGIPDFARAKAYSCIVNQYPSRDFRDRYTAEEASAKLGQMLGMVTISQGTMAPFPGGILVKLVPPEQDDNGVIIGAVGVSGAAGDEDEYCAIRGVIESNIAGLTTVPEQHSCSTVKD